jgi:acetyl/propionyl-CoA carboxylase alpha subunit
MITGLDLVKEQIRVAAGEKLSFSQEDLSIHGHAIELRVCAEDPYQQFLPNVGQVLTYLTPQGPGIRVDDCMESGMEIPIYYDNMLAKLIAWAPTREEAIQRLRRAIEEYVVVGIETTLSFGEFVLTHEAFLKGDFDTHFIAQYFKPEEGPASTLSEQELSWLVAGAALLYEQGKKASKPVSASSSQSAWQQNRRQLR